MNDAPSDRQLAAWLALWRAPGIGPARFHRLLEVCRDPAEAFALSRSELLRRGLDEGTCKALEHADWAGAEQDLAWQEAADHHILCAHDPRYPQRLRDLDDAPPILFVIGEPELLGLPQLGVVGSRNPSRGGAETAYDFSRHLAAAGVPITSGLALGVDAAAHQGALDGGGITLAVTGTGLDRVYPARHRELAHRISQQGALVSEFPTGTSVRSENFPRRNRIISGLSLGVLVVEASLRSGSLITARYATEQGREVFAIPGSIHNPLAKGCHALIRQGAKLVETADDVLEELPRPLAVLQPAGATETPAAPPSEPTLDADYQAVLDALGYDPTPLDVILDRTELTTAEVSSILLMLELEGYVAPSAGGRYARTRKGT
ncbi:DNA protecting protein DprA [Alkalilimnicola ehrlichii]|uniref:DNA protecting protein DprA n=1 Tax=Alkalilimnicola ehrlichii TaxID=351052 RepID=A0A3E0WIN5_9GAMM|nr:DNA-processing protein DprA [Alkalilimnicola ehrlichii]RFA24758.1 DNA protecting protein DprA [Alkalilimnicola ehrlichii]RFA32011.1 DNA protecting protein DprA [Alkalilimnicola ehrlichii]